MADPDGKIKKRRIIRSEGRAMIARVYHFLHEEYQFMKATNTDSCDLSPLVSVKKRTAEATGVSENTVSKILKEEKELPPSSTKFVNPLKKRRKRISKFDLVGLNSDIVRTIIQNYHIEHKRFPSLPKLKAELKEKLDFDGCTATLRNTLIKMGYNWQKNGTKRNVMVERHETRLRRYQFLKKVRQYRAEDRPIVYTGETEVTLRKPGASLRYVVVHAGTQYGFIPNASSVFESTFINTDQAKMTPDAYELWLESKLLPNLPKKSVVVIDNESYHNALTHKIPTSYSSKNDIQKWLLENSIQFDADLHKTELYEILKVNKEKFKRYKIDELIQSKGFEVARLPPYHPELNAIESIWSVLKSHLDGVTVDKRPLILNAINETIGKIDNVRWSNACSHVAGLEEEYRRYLELELELAAPDGDSDSNSDTDYIEDGASSPEDLSD